MFLEAGFLVSLLASRQTSTCQRCSSESSRSTLLLDRASRDVLRIRTDEGWMSVTSKSGKQLLNCVGWEIGWAEWDQWEDQFQSLCKFLVDGRGSVHWLVCGIVGEQTSTLKHLATWVITQQEHSGILVPHWAARSARLQALLGWTWGGQARGTLPNPSTVRAGSQSEAWLPGLNFIRTKMFSTYRKSIYLK